MALNISSDLVPRSSMTTTPTPRMIFLIGLADEVTLPKIKNKTTTVNGMGIAGDVDSPYPASLNPWRLR